MSDNADKQSPFERFEEGVKKVLAAPKSEVDKKVAERKRPRKASADSPPPSGQ